MRPSLGPRPTLHRSNRRARSAGWADGATVAEAPRTGRSCHAHEARGVAGGRVHATPVPADGVYLLVAHRSLQEPRVYPLQDAGQPPVRERDEVVDIAEIPARHGLVMLQRVVE